MAWGSVVVGVLALAAALRFIQLGHDSLWTDEGFSLRLVRSGMANFFDETTSADPNPPFYYVVLRGWIALFGDSEAALRSLSAVLGVALVFVMFELGRRSRTVVWASRQRSSPLFPEFLVHYSQEARGYALLAFLTALSYLCLLRLLDRWSGWSAVAYSAVITALLYTHVYGYFVLVAQVAFLAVKVVRWPEDPRQRRPELVRWAVVTAVPVALTVPWLVVFAGHLRDEVEGASNAKLGWLSAPSLRDLPGALSGYAGSALSLAVVLALALGAAVLAVRKHPGSKPGAAVAALGHLLLDDRRVVLLTLWLATPNLHASALPP
jgi:uncharacterized membrane protein